MTGPINVGDPIAIHYTDGRASEDGQVLDVLSGDRVYARCFPANDDRPYDRGPLHRGRAAAGGDPYWLPRDADDGDGPAGGDGDGDAGDGDAGGDGGTSEADGVDLESLNVADLKALAGRLGIDPVPKRRAALLEAIERFRSGA